MIPSYNPELIQGDVGISTFLFEYFCYINVSRFILYFVLIYNFFYSETLFSIHDFFRKDFYVKLMFYFVSIFHYYTIYHNILLKLKEIQLYQLHIQ